MKQVSVWLWAGAWFLCQCSLSFANVKEKIYEMTVKRINQILANLYSEHAFLVRGGELEERDKRFFASVDMDMDETTATMAIHQLSLYLSRFYGKKVIILLDEYDTPMQEAYVNGYWEELVSFTRSMFNSTFKTNPYLERAIMTGITRVSTPEASLGKESIFSDLNNLEVVTTTSAKYADCFGFTEEEVFASLDAYGLPDRKQQVKDWYDGFSFGDQRDIYNPWSILNYLDKKQLASYWANSSSNSLVGKLVREGSQEIKQEFETLLSGGSLRVEIDEQIVYNQLSVKRNAIWSLLLASGYLKVIGTEHKERTGLWSYCLTLTNWEVKIMFESMIRDWFSERCGEYNDFLKALLAGDVEAMNEYMNQVTEQTFSYFDVGGNPEGEHPEKFYHGFVLGLMVDLSDRYVLTSNRESGFGRYDVMLEPLGPEDDGIILEFKVFKPRKEKTLEDAVKAALEQIETKGYASALMAKGIPGERIRKYGFGFHGKRVLIGGADEI